MDAPTPAPPPMPAFDPALAAAVCAALRCGVRLTRIGKEPGLPGWPTVSAWMDAEPAFAADIAAAQVLHCELMADEILDLSDEIDKDTSLAERMRIRQAIADRKWLMSKRNPAKYGRVASAPRPAGADAAPAQPAAVPPAPPPRGRRPYEENGVVCREARQALEDGIIDTATIEIEGHVQALADFVDDKGELDPARLKLDLDTRLLALSIHNGSRRHPRETVNRPPYDPELLDAWLARPFVTSTADEDRRSTVRRGLRDPPLLAAGP